MHPMKPPVVAKAAELVGSSPPHYIVLRSENIPVWGSFEFYVPTYESFLALIECGEEEAWENRILFNNRDVGALSPFRTIEIICM